jgi:5-methylcytosine-specific restriction endonuclease McrA
MPKPCIDCGQMAFWRSQHGSRCQACEAKRNATRNADPKRQAYKGLRHIKPVGPCVKCRAMKDLTWDHIVPLAKGGLNELSNLQVLCRSCNAKKGAR